MESKKEPSPEKKPGAEGAAKAKKNIAAKAAKSIAVLKSTAHGTVEMLKGLGSSDVPTRKGSVFFVMSVVGMFLVIGVSVDRYGQIRAEKRRIALRHEEELRKQKEFMQKQTDETLAKSTMASLGRFYIELKQKEEETAPTRGVAAVFHLAEMDIVAHCDVKATCDLMEKYVDQVRDQINPLFEKMEREELLTREGKRRIKKMVMERINSWLPSGKVDDVFISRLIVS